MKKLCKLFSVLICGIFVFSASLESFAVETKYQIPDTQMTVTVPNDAYVFLPNIGIDDPQWAEAGIDDIVDTKTLYNELEVGVHFSLNSGKDNIYVSQKTTDQTGYYYNLGDLQEKTLQDFADMYNSEDGTIIAESTIYKQKNIPFIRLSLKSDYTDDGTSYELVYFTIVNGYSVSFRMIGTSEISQESENIMKAMIDSAEISEIIPKPESTANPVLAWSVLIACVLLIVLLIVLSRHNKKVRQKATKELAQKLSEYRKNASDELGESIYVNDTVHDKDAIREFSKYQAYRHHPLAAIVSIGLTVIGAIVSYNVNAAWWITLIIVVLALYCIYKFLTGAGNLERSLTRVYSKLKSNKAHYEFYENEFTISGIQSREVFPYFQITNIAENGEMIYIYFGEGTTYYVSRNGFTKGSGENFKKFILEKAKMK